ncbi:hypothetical protein pipiens_000545, partial [Culex pipiens pipiens]
VAGGEREIKSWDDVCEQAL